MNQLYIEYRHLPPGMPLLKLCGLSLVERFIITCKKAGFINLCILVHEEDREVLRERLRSTKEDSLSVCFAVPELAGEEADTSVAMGNYLSNRGYLPRFVKLNKRDLFASEGSLQFLKTACTVPGGGYWLHSTEDLKAAETYLLSGLVKQADGIISRNINRKISLWCTRRLMNTPVKPNHVTAVVFLVGILSGPVMVLSGGYAGFVLGGFLYWFANVLDGCDGELSRLRHQGTEIGAWLDTVVDDLVGLSFLLGLFYLLGSQSFFWTLAGCITILFYFLTLGPRYYVLAKYVGTGDYQVLSSQKVTKEPVTVLERIIHFVEKKVCRIDFWSFAAMVFAILNIEELFAFLFMVGCTASVIDSLSILLKMRKIQ